MDNHRHDLDSDVRHAIAAYVELQREVVEHLSGTESVAQLITDSVDEAIAALRSPIGSDISSATLRFRSLPEDVVEPALEFFTARAFEALLPNMVQLEERIGGVLRLARDATPSPRASTALSKIVRCYLLGLDAETIAMCRATLDVAVGDVVESLKAEAVARGAKVVSMRDKLEFLRSEGRLSENAEHDALEVWRHGSQVLHGNIDDVASAPGMVEKILRITAALFTLAEGPQAPIDE